MPEGYLDVELTGAGVVDTINRAGEKGITLYEVCWTGDISVRFRISVAEYFVLNKLASKQGDEIKIQGRRGIRFWIYGMIKRPVLTFTMAVLLAFSLWLPGRVLFLAVNGNDKVSAQLILQTAEECGVRFGAKRVYVRSEAVKNNLLEKLPQLQWAGVNTVGCIAVISVREDADRIKKDSGAKATNIVACRDGIVLSVTATSGSSAGRNRRAQRRRDFFPPSPTRSPTATP